MKKYSTKELNRIITSLERYCKVFHSRLKSNSYHAFTQDVEFVKKHLDLLLKNEFLIQLNISQRLIVLSLIYRVYKEVTQTSLFNVIDYFQKILGCVKEYLLQNDTSSLSIDEIQKLKLCV
jgi:hypothetical protein